MDERRFDKRIRELLDHHEEAVPERVWEKVNEGPPRRRRALAWWMTSLTLALLLAGFFYAGLQRNDPGPVTAVPAETTVPEEPAIPAALPRSVSGMPVSNPAAVGQSDPPAEPAQAATEPAGTAEPPAPVLATLLQVQQQPDTGPGEVATNVTDEPAVNATESEETASEPATEPVSASAGVGRENQALSGNATENEEPAPAEEKGSVPSMPKAPAAARHAPYSIEVIGSGEFPTKRLANAPGVTDDTYRLLRKESELHDRAYNLAVYLRTDLSDRFFVRLGVQYECIYEKLSVKLTDYFDSKVLVDTLLKGFVLDPFQPPQPYLLLDTVYDYQYNRFQHQKSNRYVMIHVPLLAGYRVQFEKFELYASGGLSLNIVTYSKGTILAPDSEYMLVLEDPGSTPFLSRTGFSAHVSMGLAYYVSPKVSFLFEPAYRYGLGNMTRSEYPLKQRYSAASVGLGLKMDF